MFFFLFRNLRIATIKVFILCVVITSITVYLIYRNENNVYINEDDVESVTRHQANNENAIKTKSTTKTPKIPDDIGKIPRASECPSDRISGNYQMVPINSTENRSKLILLWNKPLDWTIENTIQAKCQYKNCYFTKDKCDITRSDAVMFHSPSLKLEHVLKKIPGQVFVYYSYEPPCYTRGRLKDKKWHNFFNWTFHYRRDSDNMQPYVTFTKRSPKDIQEVNIDELVRSKNKTIAWFVSHCQTESKREKYIDILQRYFKVDIYGKCGPLKCNSMANRWKNGFKCLDVLDKYKFYLGFENSICRDYVTEKQLFTAYKKNNIIPITRGAYNSYLYKPPGTYIDTHDFETITDLSKFLKEVASDSKKYKSYFRIRKYYKAEEPWHYSICELCKRLNNVDRYKRLYNDLYKWEHEIDGRPVCDENPKDFSYIKDEDGFIEATYDLYA